MSNFMKCFMQCATETKNVPYMMRYDLFEQTWKRGEERFYREDGNKSLLGQSAVVLHFWVEDGSRIVWDFLPGKEDRNQLIAELHALTDQERSKVLNMKKTPMHDAPPPKDELWWQKERREKHAAMDRMVAMRNEVRKIHGM